VYSQTHVELVVQGCNNCGYRSPLRPWLWVELFINYSNFFLHAPKFMTKITKRHILHWSLLFAPLFLAPRFWALPIPCSWTSFALFESMVHIYGTMMLVPYTLVGLCNLNMPWLNNFAAWLNNKFSESYSIYLLKKIFSICSIYSISHMQQVQGLSPRATILLFPLLNLLHATSSRP
jgi:hypothetical protein